MERRKVPARPTRSRPTSTSQASAESDVCVASSIRVIACLSPIIYANVFVMSDIDSDILDFAKKKFGENCVLEKRTEWSYLFKCGSKSYCSISRFMVEPGLELAPLRFANDGPR